MKFTKAPTTLADNVQLNAGIILSTFDPATATVEPEDILFATSGGAKFVATPKYTDLGEDIDNIPPNTYQLKHLDSYEIKLSGTATSISTDSSKKLIGAADADGTNPKHIIPRATLAGTDFTDLWWVGDYSSLNGETHGGFIAIKVKKALSTGGFALKSEKDGKGKYDFEFMGHYDLSAPTTVPFDLYISAGTAEV